MTNLPEELKDFPHHLLDKLRKGTLSSHEKRQLLEKGSGWLYRLSEINTEAHSEYKMAVIGGKRTLAEEYSKVRQGVTSVSGAKLASEHSAAYLDALDKEQEAEKRWRYFKGFYEANLETINALKVSIRLDLAEWKYGGTDGQA